MEPLVLGRADIGFGHVTVDDTGVRRDYLVRNTRWLAWDAIRDYRLTIAVVPREAAEHPNLWAFTGNWVAFSGFVRGLRGDHSYRVGIELFGPGQRVAFNWRFQYARAAIEVILGRLRPRFLAGARAALATRHVAQFGPLSLAADHVQREGKARVDKADVERIDLIDTSPVKLRVMVRRKAWPYVQLPTAKLPDLCGLLDLAEELGYKVTGRKLLESITTSRA